VVVYIYLVHYIADPSPILDVIPIQLNLSYYHTLLISPCNTSQIHHVLPYIFLLASKIFDDSSIAVQEILMFFLRILSHQSLCLLFHIPSNSLPFTLLFLEVSNQIYSIFLSTPLRGYSISYEIYVSSWLPAGDPAKLCSKKQSSGRRAGRPKAAVSWFRISFQQISLADFQLDSQLAGPA